MGMTAFKGRAQSVFLLAGAALLLFTAVCYVAEPDACAAATVWPPWAWAVPGLAFTLVGCRRRGRRCILGACCVWLAYVLALCEEPKSVLLGPVRTRVATSAVSSRIVRVVSLNCSGGSAAAANEVVGLHADVVLLQESPARPDTDALARRLFGPRAAVAWGADCSVLAGGRILSTAHDMPTCATAVGVRLTRGPEVRLVSLRLCPPVFGTGILSPSYWRKQADLRRTHRKELIEVAQWLDMHDAGQPAIVGGDFNAPGWDGALKELSSRLGDTFREGGVGWGNTVLNDCPVLRFDQIWVSREFRVLAVKTYKTKNSDHRTVVCDLELR